MPKTVEFPETRNANYQQFNFRQEYQHYVNERPTPIDSEKDLHYLIKKLSEEERLQQNLSRIIRRELEAVTSQCRYTVSFQTADVLQHTSFIQRARRLDEHNQTDAALDLIYDSIDEMLRDGKFSNLDTIFRQVQTDDLSADMLLGLLTATLPARSRLSCRKKFFSEVEVSLRNRGELEDGLMTGLE